jgi:hypothetical protein
MRSLIIAAACLPAALVCVALARAPRPKPAPGSYREVVLAARPVAYWRLGEKSGTTAHDASGHQHDGRYVNRPRLGLPGAISGDRDTSIGLDGAEARSYVEIASSRDFSVATSGKGLSVEVWLRTPARLDFAGQDSADGPYVHWLGKGEPGNSEWALRFYSSKSKTRPNRISAYVFNREAAKGKKNLGAGAYFQDKLKPNAWLHVVATYDPPTQKNARAQIFRDGKPSPHNGSSGTLYRSFGVVPKAGTTPVRLGTADLRTFLSGGLDEVAIYPRVLTRQEIARHYSAGHTGR